MKKKKPSFHKSYLCLISLGIFSSPFVLYANQLNSEQPLSSSLSEFVNLQKQQNRTVTGVVKDEKGLEAPGVSIVVKETTIGTVTDIDGKFTIEAPSGATLVFSYIGYLSKEVKIGDKNYLDVVIKEDFQALEEVVVVGYSTQKKADLTGAVSSVKMSNINDMSVSGVNSALQGRMSGVTVLQSSGAPGSGTSIRIRGLGTIGNNDPLYVIDGMPADNMNDLNPGDIERIDVLKDASSAAIYGSRAANGVVIIQTKKGSDTGKINISFNTYQGFASPRKKIDVLNASQRNQIHLEAFNNSIADGNALKIPDYYTSDYAQQTRTSWQNEVLDDAAYQGNYDLSIAGGAKSAKYNIMAGHLQQDGILKRSGFNRTTFRVNTEVDILKKLKFGENLMITHSNQKLVDDMGSNGALSSALQYDPSISVYDENGNYNGSGALNADLRNPVSIINRADRKRTRQRIFGNAFLDYTFLNDFTIKTDFGYDWSKWKDKWFNSRVPEAGRPRTDNELTQREWESTRWINTTTLKYETEINQHRIMALVGTAYEAYDEEFTNARGTGFISEDKSQRYLSAATNIAWLQGGREEWALSSYFSRVDYSFADRYLFSANFRADGTSRFAKGNRWGYFPSFSGGWRISEEPFFESFKSKIENLKLRVSWGTLGNQNIAGNYPTFTQIANTTDDDGYNVEFGQGENVTIGRYEKNVANKDLKWETTRQTDIGLDISFLGKFDLGIDYYIKKTSEVLVKVPLPSLAGVDEDYWTNLGKVRNRGLEMSLAFNTKLNDLSINAYGNISKVSNKVTYLGEDRVIYPSRYRGSNITRTMAGSPIAHFFGYKSAGVFKTQEEIDNYVDVEGNKIQPEAKVGDLKFLDLNGNGEIDGDDRTEIGDGFPDFTYGLGFDLTYKGFDFSMFWQGVAGYDIFNALKYEGMFVDYSYNQFAGIMDRYHPVNNPNGHLPRVTIKDDNDNRRISDYYIDRGDYLRLKNLTIGYTFDKKIMKKFHVEKLRLYMTLQNLLTLTSYKGFDPELGDTFANELDNKAMEMGVDRGQMPQPRTFIFGLNLNF